MESNDFTLDPNNTKDRHIKKNNDGEAEEFAVISQAFLLVHSLTDKVSQTKPTSLWTFLKKTQKLFATYRTFMFEEIVEETVIATSTHQDSICLNFFAYNFEKFG